MLATGLGLVIFNQTQVQLRQPVTPPRLQLGRGVELGADGIIF